jgi:hypothetical protein
MKLVPSLLLWLALLPGLDRASIDTTPIASHARPMPALTRPAADLCMSADHTRATHPSIVRRQPAFESEETSDSKDILGSSYPSIDRPDPSRVSSQAMFNHWDVARIAPRSAILRC